VKVIRAADRRFEPAGTETFSGEVWMGTNFAADGPGTMNSAEVRFAPGARTHWHSHPDGQVLIVTEGRGRTQLVGGELTAMAAGDAVWVSSGVQHWHGADPESSMTHISITGEGGTVWDGEAVTDAEYDGRGQPG
jgi:quercetin dioxygenase-like cupin family protein